MGNKLVSYAHEKLNPENQALVLKKGFPLTVVTWFLTFSTALVFWIGFYYTGVIYSLIAATVFSIVFAITIWNHNWQKKNVHKWNKLIIKGIITDKFRDLSLRYEPGIFMVRVFKIGGQRICVKSEVYSSYQIGDCIELHLLDRVGWFKLVLRHRKLFDANLERLDNLGSVFLLKDENLDGSGLM